MRIRKLALGLFVAISFVLASIGGGVVKEGSEGSIIKNDQEITDMLNRLKSVDLGMKYADIIMLYGKPDRERVRAGKKVDASKYKYIHYYVYVLDKSDPTERWESLGFKFDENDNLVRVSFAITSNYIIGSDGQVWWNK